MGPTRPGPLRRFGPVVAILTAVVLVAGVATVKGRPSGDGAAVADDTGLGGAGGSDPTEHPDLPVYFRDADQRLEADEHDWGDGCDLKTGRVRLPSVYAPPCVPVHTGDNGGATHPGVTADSIKVVVYQPAPGNDLTAALQSVTDEVDVQQRTREAFIQMLGDVYETYGRDIEVDTIVGSGASDDEAAAIADAIRVAEEMEPFAVLNGPSLTHAFAETLADRGILCIGCGLSVPDSVYQENAPYMWGELPTPEQFIRNLGDYLVRRLLGRPAEFAGPALRDRERVFGTINFEQDPPVFDSVAEESFERGRLRGYEAVVAERYILDIPRLPERAASIIARMKAAGVTTIVFLGDPLMPGYLADAATAEDYYPEWIVTGTVLTDTTALARAFYDNDQWQHAFGLSNLAARGRLETQEPWRLHEWYYGEPPEATQTSGVIWGTAFILMLGIHMAGPNLTPETFQGGMFSYPPTGGGPTKPQISYGNHGFFTRPDYLSIDDVTEIWWDPTVEGPDEQGREEAVGMYRYANGGLRYRPGEMPSVPPARHDPATSPTLFDEPPPQDQHPEYPPPPGSPAAEG